MSYEEKNKLYKKDINLLCTSKIHGTGIFLRRDEWTLVIF